VHHVHRRERIAILGGGMSALTAAFAITNDETARRRYEVTIYQDGWLLGGKGASVRNRAMHDRIEEHGLHIWMGFYENAFQVMRACYGELGRPAGAPLATWQDAFVKHSFITLEEETREGWRHWHFHAPENDEVPGEGQEPPGPREYLLVGLRSLSHHLRAWAREGLPPRPRADETRRGLGELADSLEEAAALVNLGAASVGVTLGVASYRGVKRLLAWAGADGATGDGDTVRPTAPWRWAANVLTAFARRLARLLEDDLAQDDTSRRLWIMVDFFTANLVGMIREGLTARDADFSVLDDEEYRTWLRRHGASKLTVGSALVRGLYNLAFSWDDGAGAGTALLGTLRMLLGYRGAIYYKMQAGMGETVFTPFYEVLKRRGVRFEFFHTVKRLGVAADGKNVDRILVARQARTKDGDYQPLVDVKGLPCWPEEPLYDQLVDGEALAHRGVRPGSWSLDWPEVEERTLVRGRDFDRVVLGISLGALGPICEELTAVEPRWRAMLGAVKTTKTLAMQLWLKRDLAGLGWTKPPPVLGTYAEPFDTWADMTHLLPRESWRADDGVAHLAYFCGPFDTSAAPIDDTPEAHARERARVADAAATWLSKHAGHLFPDGADARGGLAWPLLHDDAERVGEARLAGQYVRANSDPSGRYVLSVAGTTKHRIPAHDTGFENLLVCGDWTRTGFDAGCIEAATMSGLQAARAVCGEPVHVFGEPAWLRAAARSHATARASGPVYVDRPDEMVLRAPYAMDGVRLDSFALRADEARLQALVTRYLEAPTHGALRYEVAAPFVFLVSAFTSRVSSLDPAHALRGGMPEVDVSLWIPVFSRANGAPRLSWFLPYVFVDSGAAMAAGREIYGFAKSVVDVDVTRDGDALSTLQLHGPVLPRYAPDATVVRRTLLSVTRKRGPDLTLAASVRDLFARRFVDATMNLVFLKQFRQAGAGDRASYQAIVEADATVKAMRSWRPLLSPYEVTVCDYDSHPLATELGLGRGGLETTFGVSAEMDFVMNAGREVFRAR
jgi:uncharacterized protein with NAD-binding domain and iron-sulfur cluster